MSGQGGPTLAQCSTAYTSQLWTQNAAKYSMPRQGYQQWTVQTTGTYRVTVAGAQGGGSSTSFGTNTGGLGALFTGTAILTVGNIVTIVVGQLGATMTFSTPGSGIYYVYIVEFTNTIRQYNI